MSSENLKSKADRLCGLCNETVSKYCCPRCEVFYCSLDCYKSEKHSQCSESFYRECVNEELSSLHVDDVSKQKMIDILKKMHDENIEDDGDILEESENIEENIEEIDSDDCSENDLHTRIKDLNLDNPDALWNALTEDERNEFEAMLSNGDMGPIIPQWEPWWTHRKEKKLLEEVNEANVDSNKLTECPDIKSVPMFSSLTSNKPSEAIRYNMANVLASYAFAARYFNGEVEALEAASHLLDISANLNSNANFEDADIAVESVVQRCLQSEYIHTDKASLDVMKNDVYLILQGPSDDNKLHYSKSALSHLIQIFTEAKAKYKLKNKIDKHNGEFYKKFPEHGNTHLPELDVSKVKKIVKKLEYYLSFLNSCDNKSN
ncbi:zinc finger HIT domain-containing protein 2 [Bicyclus anynana]|uniref:Zinc finger HIT domain-containing protein 2 n=1 Tax=Bicyclus anynana TaxID=110368 RepID=A0A6J1NAF8_BICAN|nr:zinc finger HIT domain-containing protein 2 [Bicyclus anynana]